MTDTKQEERSHYSRAFKHSVIQEYLGGGISKTALLKKYNIKIHGGIVRWMRQLGYIGNEEKDRYLLPVKSLSLSSEKVNKVPVLSSNDLQEQRIKDLERLLADEQLRSEAYRRIIDIAEKEYNIPIRKKPNTR